MLDDLGADTLRSRQYRAMEMFDAPYLEAGAALSVQDFRARADDRAMDFETLARASDLEVGVSRIQVQPTNAVHDGGHAAHGETLEESVS